MDEALAWLLWYNRRRLLEAGLLQSVAVRGELGGSPGTDSQFLTWLWGTDCRGKVTLQSQQFFPHREAPPKTA